MAKENNGFSNSVGALMEGLDGLVSSKTVVGDPVYVGDAIILPLIDMKFGVAAGAFNNVNKDRSAGGLGATLSTSAVLVIQNGMTKVVTIHDQNATSKLLDMVPDIVNRFTKGSVSDPAVDQTVSDILHEGKEVRKQP